MGKRKNCLKKRLLNFPKAQATPLPPISPALGDSDTDNTDEDFAPPEHVDSSSDSESVLDIESDGEFVKDLKNEADLLEFTAKLQAAHNHMVSEEREKRARMKRKPIYTGNSDRTKRRKRSQGKKMEEKGYPPIQTFFTKKPVASVPERGTVSDIMHL